MPALFNDGRGVDLRPLNLGFVNHRFILFFAGVFHAFALLLPRRQCIVRGHCPLNGERRVAARRRPRLLCSKRRARAAERFVPFLPSPCHTPRFGSAIGADLCHPHPPPAPFTRDAWPLELKHDGFRALARTGRSGAQLVSRSGRSKRTMMYVPRGGRRGLRGHRH
jgi:hypothetical protein